MKDGNVLAALSKAEMSVQKEMKVPAGYIPMELSTNGLVGAPKKFHIRNFTTRTILDLAILNEAELPFKMVGILDALIYEEDVSVAEFHEREVVELIMRMYHEFFSPTLELPYPILQEDIDWLHKNKPEGEAKKLEEDLTSGRWKPRITVDLSNVEMYDLDPNFSPYLTVSKKDFKAVFGFPRFGDALVVKQWSEEVFGEKEKQFAQVGQLMKLRNQMLSDYKVGKAVNLDKIPVISTKQEDEYNEFYAMKAAVLIDVIRGLYLRELDGQDVSGFSLTDRAKMIEQDARFDIKLAKKIDSFYNDLRFGINQDYSCESPISNAITTRRLSFRLMDIFQAIQLYEDDEFDIVVGKDH